MIRTMVAEEPVTRPTFHRKRTSEIKDDLSDSGESSLAAEPKTKARARINMACVHCRHRKIKCDGTQPSCATCKRLRRHCEYEPVTEIENLMSRERKRRNKEKKAARLASLSVYSGNSLSVYSGNSPLSMLHPGSWAVASGAVRHFMTDGPSAPVSPSFTDYVPAHHDITAYGLRPRSNTVNTGFPPSGLAVEALPYHLSSVSQPQTPEVSDRSLGSTSVAGSSSEVYQNRYFFGIPPFSEESTHSNDGFKQPCSPASASNAEFVLSTVYSSELPVAVPTSAHVRPIDLPAPHGHFDFASVPFPTQDSFSAEAPLLSLRRRSSVPNTFDYSQLRRPSVAEIATVGLLHRVAEKRAEKVEQDDNDRIRSAQAFAFGTSDLVSSWRETTTQLWNDSFSLHSPIAEVPPSAPRRSAPTGAVSFDPVAASHYAQDLSAAATSPAPREVSYGSLTASTSSTDSSSVHDSYFSQATTTAATSTSRGLDTWSSPASTTVSHSAVTAPWDALQQQAPLLSPVTDLSQTFHNLGAGLQTSDYGNATTTTGSLLAGASSAAYSSSTNQPTPSSFSQASSTGSRSRESSNLAGSAPFQYHHQQQQPPFPN